MLKVSELFFNLGKFAAGHKLIMVAFCLTVTIVLGLGMVDMRLEVIFYFVQDFIVFNISVTTPTIMGE